jgi:hypothetical protein
MTRDALKAIVKDKIDELTPFDGGLALITSDANVANNPVDIYIEQFIDASARETLLEAPVHTLPLTVFSTIAYDTTTNKTAKITLPANFLRLAVIKFSSWDRPVFRVTYPGDPEYNKQFDKYLRSGKSRPKVIWIDEAGTPKLLCYGVESATGNDTQYTAETVAEDMPDILLDPMTWHCAFTVLEVFGRDKLSQMAFGRFEKSLNLLQ